MQISVHQFSLKSVGSDPVQEVRHLSEDPRVGSQSATLTKGDNSVLDGAGTSAGEEGAARISLARVDSTVGGISGAQHGWENLGVGSGTTISAVASIIVDNWNIDAA